MLGDPLGPPLTFSPHLSLFLSADTTTAAAHLEGSVGVEGAGRGFFLLHLEGKNVRRRMAAAGQRRGVLPRMGMGISAVAAQLNPRRETRGQAVREWGRGEDCSCSGSIGLAGPNNSRSLILLREHRPSPFRAPSGVEGASNGQKRLEVLIRRLRY